MQAHFPPLVSRLSRALLVVGAVLGIVGAGVQALAWSAGQENLATLLSSSGVAAAQPEAAERVANERTLSHARLGAARSLVYHLLALYATGAAESEIRAATAGLAEARVLAADTLRRQPGSWQASMLLGTATYLDGSIHRDRRLYTEPRRWEAPLERAVREAPSHPEPRRLLATAYLETWTSLSPEKRDIARELLRAVFADDLRTLDTLGPTWLAVADDLDDAFAILPDEPHVWRALGSQFAAESRWAPVRTTRQRELESAWKRTRDRVAEGRERVRLGDAYRGRSILLRAIASAPPSERFVPLVEEALAAYPPGIHGLQATDALRGWLEWALELDRLGIETLSPIAVSRLLDAISGSSPAFTAHAALYAGDLYRADRAERLTESFRQPNWVPYLTARARRQARDGEIDAARQSLERVVSTGRRDLPFALAALEVARAADDPALLADAERRLETFSRETWETDAWVWQRRRPTLALLPSRTAGGLVIEFTNLPETGVVIEPTLDGRSLGPRIVRPDRPLRLAVPLDARAHLLGIESLAGGRVAPGRVALAGS